MVSISTKNFRLSQHLDTKALRTLPAYSEKVSVKKMNVISYSIGIETNISVISSEDLKSSCFRDAHKDALSKCQFKICYHNTDAHKIGAVSLSLWALITLPTRDQLAVNVFLIYHSHF